MSDRTRELECVIADLKQQVRDAEKERDALRSKIEAAENDAAHQKALAASALRVAEGWERKCGELRAKIEAMEKQVPVAEIVSFGCHDLKEVAWKKGKMPALGSKLYALPGAQNVPKAVAYLDLGTGGYMDIGTDLTDEALAALPKGRHMLGIVGTYGVDGYVPAQNAPSVPEGWEKELFCIQHAMAMNNWNWDSDASNDMKRAAYAAVVKLLAAAPEAKP